MPADLAAALEAIRYGPYVVAAFLTDERVRMPWDDLYALVAPKRSFNMFFNTVNVLRDAGPRKPGGSITVYGAANLARALAEASDEVVAETFARDLRAIFPQAHGITKEVLVHRWPQGIPYSAPGRSTYQERLERPFGQVVLAGDYLGERGGMDTAVTSGVEAAATARVLCATPARARVRDDA